MKRILCYIVILAAVLALPVKRTDVGKLRPIETVSVIKEHGWYVMETDTGDKGFGGSPLQALRNLKETSTGIIYLDTAEYLLVSKDTLDAAEELRSQMKESVRLCIAEGNPDLAEVSKFLDVHGGLPRLRAWENGHDLPVISKFGDSLIFLKKVENSA